MRNTYTINKGINAPVEFKGLKAQWIWWIGGLVVGLIIFFMVLYMLGVNSFLCVGIVMVLGAFGVTRIYSLSAKYGEHGMMKMNAAKKVPKVLRSVDRKLFYAD